MLRRPLITEKNTRLIEANNQYTFEVDPEANKIQIREAVEKIFNVRVKAVNTLNVKPKPKSRMRPAVAAASVGAKRWLEEGDRDARTRASASTSSSRSSGPGKKEDR